MNKFEKQEKEMAEQEMRHKEELYEAEKSIVTKKDMYVSLKNSNLKIIFKLRMFIQIHISIENR